MAHSKNESGTAPPAWTSGHPDEHANRAGELSLKAELVFVAALLIFGGGAMLALMAGAPWVIAALALAAAGIAYIPYAAGWTKSGRYAKPEVLTLGQFGANKNWPLEPGFSDEETGIYAEWDNADENPSPEQRPDA